MLKKGCMGNTSGDICSSSVDDIGLTSPHEANGYKSFAFNGKVRSSRILSVHRSVVSQTLDSYNL